MKSTVEHPRLGIVHISQTRRAKRISLSVRPPDIVRLSFPVRVSLREAMAFVEAKAEWVEKIKAKLAEKYAVEPVAMPFSTRSHTLVLMPQPVEKISSKLVADQIRVTYPLDVHYTSAEVQTVIKEGIIKALKIESKEYLPERTHAIARQFSLECGRVSVRDSRSRWGSCSHRNDISLSIHLMLLPDELIDYIIMHELCHIKVKNHSDKFYAMLDTMVDGRHKELNGRIKSYRIGVF